MFGIIGIVVIIVMVAAIVVDISGMPEAEVTRILERLARLGIVSLT